MELAIGEKYIVRLTEEERTDLESLIHKGKAAAHKRLYAEILLKADISELGEKWLDSQISEAFGISTRTVERVRERLVQEGLESALNRAKPTRVKSCVKAFAPEEARRILDKLEIYYTPKHGSWLNMAEIELNILSRQCLDRRIPDQEPLRMEIAAWQEQRNAIAQPMEWRFTNEDTRVKLNKILPDNTKMTEY